MGLMLAQRGIAAVQLDLVDREGHRTPVGPIRVDLGYAPNTPRFFGFSGTLDELLKLPPDEPLCAAPSPQCVDQRISRFQFHFSLGQTF